MLDTSADLLIGGTPRVPARTEKTRSTTPLKDAVENSQALSDNYRVILDC